MKANTLFLCSLAIVGGCSQATSDGEDASTGLGAQAASAEKPAFATMSFPSKEGRMLELEVYPAKGGKKQLNCAVVLIHGGGWVSGGKEEMRAIGSTLSEAGFTGVSIDYTLAQVKHWPAQLEDAQAAVRFVRSHATELGINPDRIGAAGVSAGGHLSMFLGTTDAPEKGVSSKVQAVCSISGIHDLNEPLTPAGSRYRIVEALLGEGAEPDKKLRREASPVDRVDKDSAPTLFVQGKQDPLVPQAQSDLALKRLKAARVDAREILVDGMGHGIAPSN